MAMTGCFISSKLTGAQTGVCSAPLVLNRYLDFAPSDVRGRLADRYAMHEHHLSAEPL